MTTIITPIVGSHFRPPAKQVLTALPLGTPLTLVPEPDNPYDEHAIRVQVALRATYPVAEWAKLEKALEGTSWNPHDLMAQEAIDGPLQLGYIPKSGSKTCQGGPGNLEVAKAISTPEGDREFTARLSIAPEGYPTVLIVISDWKEPQ